MEKQQKGDFTSNAMAEPVPVINMKESEKQPSGQFSEHGSNTAGLLSDTQVAETGTSLLNTGQETSMCAIPPNPQLPEPGHKGRGRPRKSDTPKKLDEVQLSELESTTDFMLVTPSLKRGRGRPPNPFKPPKPDFQRPRGRPRIHPMKIPSFRGPGRPRIHPPKIERFARPMNMTKTLEVRLVKCTVREGKRRGRPPGAKNKKKSVREAEKNKIKRQRGRPRKNDENGKMSMSYQDFVRQVNEELLAINGTLNEESAEMKDDSSEMEDDLSEMEDNTSEMEYDTDSEISDFLKNKSKRKRGRPPGSKNKIKKNSENSREFSSSPSNRKRGRPPGSKNIITDKTKENKIVENIEGSTDSDIENNPYHEESHRKRGRPPGAKNKKSRTSTSSTEGEPHSTSSSLELEHIDNKTRKRGRPPGSKNKPKISDNESSLERVLTEKRSPGRPKKNLEDLDSPIKESRSPGSPKKNLDPGSPNLEYNSTEQISESSQLSSADSSMEKKRGRPKGSLNKKTENKSSDGRLSRHCKGDVSYMETMEDIIEVISDTDDLSDIQDNVQEKLVKRGRGRPPKQNNGNIFSSVSIKRKTTENSDQESPRKRGRPRKDSVIKKDRSCKSHVDYVALDNGSDIEADEDSDLDSSEAETFINVSVIYANQKGRRGRPKKSSSNFIYSDHDSKSEKVSTDEEHFIKGEEKRGRGRPKTILKNVVSGLNDMSKDINTGEKKSVGRPKKYMQNDGSVSEQTGVNDSHSENGVSDLQTVVEIGEKKHVGRPKKIVPSSGFISTSHESQNQNHHRGRGRPKKTEKSDLTSGNVSLTTKDLDKASRGPGRPKKMVTTTGAAADEHLLPSLGRGRGRPKKVQPTLDMTDACEDEESPDTTGIGSIMMEGWEGFSKNIEKRARGRPKKIKNGISHDSTEGCPNGMGSCHVASVENRVILSVDSSNEAHETEIATKIVDKDTINSSNKTITFIDDIIITKNSKDCPSKSVNGTSNVPQNNLQNNLPRTVSIVSDNSTQILGMVVSSSKADKLSSQVDPITATNATITKITDPVVPLVTKNSRLNDESPPFIATAVVSSSQTVVTDCVPHTNVVTESIPQNYDPVQMSSIFLDLTNS